MGPHPHASTTWRVPLSSGSEAIDVTDHNRRVLAEQIDQHVAEYRAANPRPETDREEPDVTDTYDPATEGQHIDPATTDPRHAVGNMPDDVPTERIKLAEPCPHCHGTGHVLTTNDYLRESLTLLGDQGDSVVAEFYARLLTEAPDLAPLFPADLVDPLAGAGSPGRLQRDKLLGALVAVSQTYDRADPAAMEILDTHLATFGRSHANFQRPDGTVRGATLAEYHAVKVVLFGTLHDAAGEAWRPEYDDAWSEAYDYAVGEMLHAQNHTDMTAARYRRPSPRPR
jgi:hemoglobin-like flavoprotein